MKSSDIAQQKCAVMSSECISDLSTVTTTKPIIAAANQGDSTESTSDLVSNTKYEISSSLGELRTSSTPVLELNTSLKKSALLSALNCVYESVESSDSTESLLAEAVRKVDTPDGVRLLRALTFATSDLEFDSDLCSDLSDSLARIPSRFFEQQSAAKGVNVNEVRKMHNRQLLLQQSFDRDFDHDLWEELTAKCEHENRHHFLSISDSKSNSPNCHGEVSSRSGTRERRLAESDHSRYASGSGIMQKNKTTSQQVIENGTLQKNSYENASPVNRQNCDKKKTNDREGRAFSLTRKISCPQINYISWNGVQSDSSTNSNSATLPESATQYLALVGGLLSELSPDSELNQMYFIEIALVSSIQSLKLSLDFYRYFMFHSGCKINQNSSKNDFKTDNEDCEPANHNDRLYLQNLYLDTLQVETMLYDCLDRFRHNKGRAFATKHIQKLQKAVKKMNSIQEALHRITSSSSSPTTTSPSTPIVTSNSSSASCSS